MRNRVISSFVTVAAAVSLAACGSSGGASVSTSKLESKLRNDSSVKSVLSQVGSNKKVADALVGCIAKAIKDNASQSDLSDYVSGDKSLNEISGNSKGAEGEAKACAMNAVKSLK